MRCDALGSPNSFINLTNWRVGEITFYWWPSRGRCAMKAILLLNKKIKITFSQFDIFPLMCSKQVTRISSVYGDVLLFGFYHFLLHLCCCSTAVGEIRNRLVADWNFSFKQGTGPKEKIAMPLLGPTRSILMRQATQGRRGRASFANDVSGTRILGLARLKDFSK